MSRARTAMQRPRLRHAPWAEHVERHELEAATDRMAAALVSAFCLLVDAGVPVPSHVEQLAGGHFCGPLTPRAFRVLVECFRHRLLLADAVNVEPAAVVALAAALHLPARTVARTLRSLRRGGWLRLNRHPGEPSRFPLELIAR